MTDQETLDLIDLAMEKYKEITFIPDMEVPLVIGWGCSRCKENAINFKVNLHM